MVSYRCAFGIGGSPSSQGTYEKFILYPQATPEALHFFYATNWEKEIARISPSEKFAYPTTRLIKHPANSASTYCWVWVPPSSPSSWAMLTAKRDRSLSDPSLRMLSLSLVQPWCHLGILSTSVNQKIISPKLILVEKFLLDLAYNKLYLSYAT